MALVPYDPFRQLTNIRRDFDRFFSDFPSTVGFEQNLGSVRADVHETENEMVALCNLPGVEKKEDVDIHIESNTLSISGSINRTNETKEENMHRKERFVGHFQRSVSFPKPVSHEGVKATIKMGFWK
ncbi:hypothetical protein KP78_02970 [Jeotgalibacillus soli]|uniref:SHSP domain-containing protein n=1 Tax=Jeotgalibacillus soli TaxID=889306 RepID=A0A0C2VSM8_9BACL|nr:hypothetical protein KP78_02970 [Jeotgalibacillus soli]